MKKYILLFLLLGVTIQLSFGMSQDQQDVAYWGQKAFETYPREINDARTLLNAIDSLDVKNLEKIFKEHPTINVNARNRFGHSALNELTGHIVEETIKDPLPMAELLVKRGADVNIQNAEKQTPLWGAILWAWRSGNNAYLKLLLDNGANPLLEDEEGRSPLDWAKTSTTAENSTIKDKAIFELLDKAAEKFR